MNEPYRTQFEVRCAFNGFCKKALKCEAINACRDIRYRQAREVSFSDLTADEEARLCRTDTYSFDEAERAFSVAGKTFTAKQLAEALSALPEEKRRIVLLYYFFDMTDAQIARHLNVPRSTVQFRRTSSFEPLKNYLEGRAYDETEW